MIWKVILRVELYLILYSLRNMLLLSTVMEGWNGLISITQILWKKNKYRKNHFIWKNIMNSLRLSIMQLIIISLRRYLLRIKMGSFP